jgi:anti-anti-sigma factor
MALVDVENRKDGVILVPHGGLIGGDLTESLENAVDEALKQPIRFLIVDMSDIDHINSIGMAAVIRAHAQSRKNGTRFTMCRARERIRTAFEITRLTTLDILCESLEQALEAGGGKP